MRGQMLKPGPSTVFAEPLTSMASEVAAVTCLGIGENISGVGGFPLPVKVAKVAVGTCVYGATRTNSVDSAGVGITS